jgi:serine/threonine protein kinase
MKIGQIIKERYEILEVLGEGGMAFVYKAMDTQLERYVAIKTLKPNYVNQETFVERFRREAKTAANLNHPNIVQIFDWGIEEEPFFVMEYIEGNTLTSIVAKNRTISLSDVLFIGAQVASGLQAAHQKGLVHRDIKPGNIMITPNGKVKVTDFGIVSLQNEESDITKTGSILGTASYISPEQAQGRPVSIESDLYSLGTVLYELIAGKPPFSGESPISTATKHLTDKPEKLSNFRKDIPKGVENAVLKLLEKSTFEPGLIFVPAIGFCEIINPLGMLSSLTSSCWPTLKPLSSITYIALSVSRSTMYGIGNASGPTDTIMVTRVSGFVTVFAVG